MALSLDERIEAITAEIEKIAAEEASCQRLISVPGVGPIISTAMVAAVGDGEAFERGRAFGAWLGLVPKQYSTGGKPILGRISKQGNRYLRTLFIQAANDLAMFNLAIDSKLRGCALVPLKIDDLCVGGRLRDRATII